VNLSSCERFTCTRGDRDDFSGTEGIARTLLHAQGEKEFKNTDFIELEKGKKNALHT